MKEIFVGIEILLKNMKPSPQQEHLLNVTLPNVQKALTIISAIKPKILHSLKKIRGKRAYKTYYGKEFDDIIPILVSVIQKTLSGQDSSSIIAKHEEDFENVFSEAPNEAERNEHIQEVIETIIPPIIKKVLSSIK